MTAPFDSVLVANRGEIARRIIRTLRALGIRSIAVYSDADASAPHVREADAAVRLGPAPASQSYLSLDALRAALRRSGAAALHPGYGFLSESVALAHLCGEEGVTFIGPRVHALEVMGDKIRARAHVAERGVPIVPGFSAAGLSDAEIATAAASAGYPLLVKPSAGGGGKGMQIVRGEDELDAALASARRTAAAAFGDDTLLLERLIERPRHIEVQVLADEHGTVVHLGERECTLQRRHQKVIEEAPSPAVDAPLRARLGSAACAVAASVDYRGAGTVEFLMPGGSDEFFFIEMNTRLQVEHPVTEAVTGLDLVAAQVRIAAGEPLGFRQDDVELRGHAVEARVYAESPARGFLPATGEVRAWRAAPGARTDAAIESGSRVTADYDPMIAKVIASASDRATAVARLDRALADTVVLGLETNLAYLRAVLADPRVIVGALDTGILATIPPPAEPPPPPDVLAAAADAAPLLPLASGPWGRIDGWRAAADGPAATAWFQTPDGTLHEVERRRHADDGTGADTTVARDAAGTVWVHAHGAIWQLAPVGRRERTLRAVAARDPGASAPADGMLRTPLPGTVVAVHVAEGTRVSAGERIVSVEAMKMEHTLLAPHDGVVRLRVAVGDVLPRDAVVAVIHPEDEEHTHDA